jgi:hypothetical protein
MLEGSILVALIFKIHCKASIARHKIRAASAGDFFLSSRFALIGSLESPPSNLLRATRKPDVLVLSEIHG